jgi:hypothetical protein
MDMDVLHNMGLDGVPGVDSPLKGVDSPCGRWGCAYVPPEGIPKGNPNYEEGVITSFRHTAQPTPVPCCEYEYTQVGYFGPYINEPCIACVRDENGDMKPVELSAIKWPQKYHIERYTWAEMLWILILLFSLLAFIFYW